MPGASRDRVTIDLRGIGDAVRAAAACRGMGVAQLVRRALVMSLNLRATAPVSPTKRGSDGQTPDQVPTRETAKLTLRLPQAHADALMLNAGALGLSYGDYVEQLTFLLVLKMADEQAKPPFNKPSPIPKGFGWGAQLILQQAFSGRLATADAFG